MGGAKKLNVLMTGSSGVIGKHLVESFERRYHLVTFDRSPAQNRPVDVLGDLCDFRALKAAMKGIDVLVHLAATSDEASFPKELLPNNILGVYNTFQAAQKAGIRRIVFASSCQTVTMYGRDERVQISQPVRPGSVYGVTKVFGEVLGRYYHDRFGIEFAGLRLGAFASYNDPDLQGPSWLWRLWLSPRDAVSLFRCAIEKHKIGYTLVFGTSRTRPEVLTLKPAKERLGFIPRDDVAKAVSGLNPAESVGARNSRRRVRSAKAAKR